MRLSLAVLALGSVCVLAAPVHAQSEPANVLSAADVAALDPDAIEIPTPPPAVPLVIHVDAELEGYGPALVRTLARRIDGEVELGAAPPGRVAAALPVGHVGVVPTEVHDRSMATVTLVGRGGRIYETEVALPRQRDSALRALALAVIDLRDASLEPPPLEEEPIFAGETAEAHASRYSYVYIEPEGGLFGRQRSIESIARPTIYFRALIGFSTSRQSLLVGPGVGVGLCIGDHCVVIEGELPVLEQQRVVRPSRPTLSEVTTTISYRAVNLALRLQVRPIRIDDVTIGATLGLMTRVGSAWTSDGESSMVSGFGIRGSVEIAWQFERPFEWVFEAGTDGAINAPRFLFGGGQSMQLDEDVTVWGVTALRVRP